MPTYEGYVSAVETHTSRVILTLSGPDLGRVGSVKIDVGPSMQRSDDPNLADLFAGRRFRFDVDAQNRATASVGAPIARVDPVAKLEDLRADTEREAKLRAKRAEREREQREGRVRP